MKAAAVGALVVLVLGGPQLAVAEECMKEPPSQVAAGFKHKRTSLFVTSQGAARHRGQDVLVVPGQPQWLIAKFAYGQMDKDLKDEQVDIYVQRQPPCGEWTLLATRKTTTDGQKGTIQGIKDDGGRIFFEIPAELRLPEGRYPVRMRVRGDQTEAAFDLVVVAPGTRLAVFDIDGTLTTHDKEVTREYLADLVDQDYDPAMYAGAKAVVQVWDKAGYTIVYLTGRPDFLREPTEGWLMEQGFPRGVIHLTDTLDQFLPTSDGVATYKADYLRSLQAQGLIVAAAYGNAPTDIEAYGRVGIDARWTFIIGPHAGALGTSAVESYPEHLKSLQMPR